ncbi:hypothetical protein FA95DRAFT_1029313 [Auriscalpium vulgare]|uniref:Uncharacterized protein n=1 Tax=Auriscalpium vulgare TaxID=40419 RepID=A0ACB8R5G0_9AGAM|nr:hypothetical protein FA95DRAFT_1029313 [Auriscalpium vulgare]
MLFGTRRVFTSGTRHTPKRCHQLWPGRPCGLWHESAVHVAWHSPDHHHLRRWFQGCAYKSLSWARFLLLWWALVRSRLGGGTRGCN